MPYHQHALALLIFALQALPRAPSPHAWYEPHCRGSDQCASVDCNHGGGCYAGACFCVGGRTGAGCAVAPPASSAVPVLAAEVRVHANDTRGILGGLASLFAYGTEAAVSVGPGVYTGGNNTNLRAMLSPHVRHIVATGSAAATHINGSWSSDEARPTGAVRSLIYANASVGEGGLTVASSVEGFTVTNCGSPASSGGVVTLVAGAGLTVRSCRFLYNTAAFGGVLYASAGQARIYSSELRDNTAREDGGALHVSNGATITLSTVLMVGNTATSRGGGIYSSVAALLDMSNTVLTHNTAARGGSVFDSGSLVRVATTSMLINTGSPPGLHCHNSLTQFTTAAINPPASAANCGCDTNRATWVTAGYIWTDSQQIGATCAPVPVWNLEGAREISVGLDRMAAAVAGSRQFFFGSTGEQWSFCPRAADVSKPHQLVISSLRTRQFEEFVEVFDGTSTRHPQIATFTNAGGWTLTRCVGTRLHSVKPSVWLY
jgi:predicted outer membrane repeat protein|eukprot:COSAG01_NODE_9233_length_2511_cov_1.742123_1_plen_489_part_00